MNYTTNRGMWFGELQHKILNRLYWLLRKQDRLGKWFLLKVNPGGYGSLNTRTGRWSRWYLNKVVLPQRRKLWKLHDRMYEARYGHPCDDIPFTLSHDITYY